ncbi:MAG: 23S rRNA (adenine(1618)-N(6))-methyltransferase RlmF [Candidatus Marinimicrobia bacterium]|nr:23S rRNA (adenine(1618)-N(6))-methyltransferase RlmF [Candidatus Neomarinimicrobiota bacterium]
MSIENNQETTSRLHPRNKNREQYDLAALVSLYPKLENYIKPNKFGVKSVDFSNPHAVKILNKAILDHYYGIKNWDFPSENLCPAIPGRADYIHHIADLLSEYNSGVIPIGKKITCYDIGVGASCIYPIIGVVEYNWNFIGSETDPKSLISANAIVKFNPSLKNKIECKLQKNPNDIFFGIIDMEDKIDLSICNPPFHSSAEEAQKVTQRKVKNLSGRNSEFPTRNFAGISNELICDGGEYKFIMNMIRESKLFSKNCYWFSTLVSKQSNLKGITITLKKAGATQIRTIPMGTGNKSTRIVAWTFFSEEEQKEWAETRW